MLWPTYTPVHNWRNTLNKSGLYKIHIRITFGYTSRYYEVKTPLKVTTHEWNFRSKIQWVRNSHPYADSINALIAQKLNLIRGLVNRYFSMGFALHFKEVFAE